MNTKSVESFNWADPDRHIEKRKTDILMVKDILKSTLFKMLLRKKERLHVVTLSASTLEFETLFATFTQEINKEVIFHPIERNEQVFKKLFENLAIYTNPINVKLNKYELKGYPKYTVELQYSPTEIEEYFSRHLNPAPNLVMLDFMGTWAISKERVFSKMISNPCMKDPFIVSITIAKSRGHKVVIKDLNQYTKKHFDSYSIKLTEEEKNESKTLGLINKLFDICKKHKRKLNCIGLYKYKEQGSPSIEHKFLFEVT